MGKKKKIRDIVLAIVNIVLKKIETKWGHDDDDRTDTTRTNKRIIHSVFYK